ncbi:hypothetical protein CYLTODRAFT_263376 [Cylindrobasidium torrendii FP15055 ss-10]|uniref:Secreted protein n=1 Tax=Cylindrobasidium torrendii FP15055 ss-10 TaxID=1314674 RepID=A0A0D7ARQ5_9AGAR|nr:hypothetical protein CYLTODRAFT_263376 [Cylindrobasidium torrendii FP15055 ss-10]
MSKVCVAIFLLEVHCASRCLLPLQLWTSSTPSTMYASTARFLLPIPDPFHRCFARLIDSAGIPRPSPAFVPVGVNPESTPHSQWSNALDVYDSDGPVMKISYSRYSSAVPCRSLRWN